MQRFGLRRGRDVQLLLQDVSAALVASQRQAELASLGVEAHQRPMGLLLEGIQGNEPLGGRDAVRTRRQL
ncbi:MAG TPA: hypothetical protein VF031_10575 [Alphaproteobacteria bacterium]